jgi:hypothetical protein
MATNDKNDAAANRRKESGVKRFTRHEAERQVAATNDRDKLTELAGHPNSHVVKSAKYKLAKLAPAA